ncbi:MAG: hypothetical protein MJB57_11525, partial [Gemmatimonadetes bacterium]|nr:hypothetical protein [Gemmatimonadota bacterium]
GTISDGVVEATLAAGEQFSEKKWDGYQPVAAVLLARVRPTSEAEASLWRQFNELSIEVRGRK